MDELEALEEKINRLKREYDLFLAGQRKGEPASLRTEVERDVLRLSRCSFPSTATRFRMSSLAHRFRAVAAQIRLLLEAREAQRKDGQPSPKDSAPAVVVDRVALDNPKVVEPQIRSLHRALAESFGDRPVPPIETLRERLLNEASRMVAQGGVLAVRFLLVPGEKGPRIRGEILPDREAKDPEAPTG